MNLAHDISYNETKGILTVDDCIINMKNVMCIKKFDKTRAQHNCYTIGIAMTSQTEDMRLWQFIYESDNKTDRDNVMKCIKSAIEA